MKRITILFFLTAFLYASGWSQSVPLGMKYQAVARDHSGNVIANKEIELKVNLHSDIVHQSVEYSEFHVVKTNEVGLFTLVIGDGTILEGDFAKIPWSNKDIWMEVSIRDKEDSEFEVISDSRLLAVPYAFHAGTASELLGDGYRGPGNGVPANVWSLFGNSNTDDTEDVLGTTDCADLVFITNDIERLRITCEGVVNIADDLNVGADLDVANDVHIGNDLTVDQDVFLNVDGGNTTVNGDLTVANMSPTHLTGTLEVDKATDLNLTLNVDGTTDLNDDLTVTGMSSTLLTGTLEVDKATDLNLTLNVDGTTNLNDDLTVTGMSSTHLTGTLEVDKATDLNLTLNVEGASTLAGMVSITNATESSSTGTGALKVTGGAGIAKNVHIGGTLTTAGVATINNTLNVNGSSNYVANFVNSTNANGISIKVAAATPSTSNNFVTMQNSGGTTVGRIEGQTLDELHVSFDYIWFHTMEALHTAFQIAMVVVDLVGLDDADAAIVEGVELVQIIAEWAEVAINLDLRIGVAYESGSGDYAEWLEKASPEEVFSHGDIVGVKGGKISKAMENPDQYMVVSQSPIVLGNMPEEGKTELYEMVAFMGQVPVKVRGVVNIGDYIISSELEDGFGRAVSADDMTLDQFKRIVGVAWTESDGKKPYSSINVAVGINTNDTVDKLKKQQEELEAVKQSLNGILSYLQAKDPLFDADMFAVNSQRETENKNDLQRPTETIADLSGMNKIDAIVSLLEANPEMMSDMLADTRTILENDGIDYNRFEQTRRLLNDETYFISILKEMSKRN